MTYLQSILLGIIQGVTEFLPISSSAHLALIPELLGWQLPSQDIFAFYILIQVASLVGVFIYFRKDLSAIVTSFVAGIRKRQPFAETDSLLGWYILLATIPAGVVGLAFKDAIEGFFSNPAAIGFFLICTALLLVLAERNGKRQRRIDQLTWKDALWIGFFQVLSLLPGVSRSGATIAGGMTRDLQRPVATRFAFLMSIPVLLSAGLLAGLNLAQSPDLGRELPVFLSGFVASAATSYLAIRWLLAYVKHHSLYIFAAYCALLGTTVLLTQAGGAW
ncbi:MAG: undecaprenyl-diphosphatase UppP [Anaerolineales bacterium]|nr:undecaprenyl-diphosphatase UppP [Anaerolineales bacterium]